MYNVAKFHFILLFYFGPKTEKKKEDLQIATPLDARHVRGMQNFMHLNDPFAQQTRFNVEVRMM